MKLFPLNSLMKCEADIGDVITFRKKFLSLCGVLCLLLNLNSPIQAAPFPGENAESIITQAMLQSSPSLVRIETQHPAGN